MEKEVGTPAVQEKETLGVGFTDGSGSKRSYHAPRVVEIGSVLDFTAGSGPAPGDASTGLSTQAR